MIFRDVGGRERVKKRKPYTFHKDTATHALGTVHTGRFLSTDKCRLLYEPVYVDRLLVRSADVFFLSDDKIYTERHKRLQIPAEILYSVCEIYNRRYGTAAFYHVISFKFYTKYSIIYTKTICKI